MVAITGMHTSAARADVFSDVPEAAGDRLVYTLPIDNSDAYNTTGVPYLVNNAASIANGSFSRVGYYMELQPVGGGPTSFAYASFDSSGFTNNAAQLGVPTTGSGEFYNQAVTNLDVVSNVAGVTTGTGLSGGTVQFWPSNYGPDPSTGQFDYADTGANNNNGYGHLEIGNTAAAQSILNFSNWGGNGGNNNVGFGNQPTGNPDYTFATNAGNYQLKELQVVVNTASLPSAPAAPAALVANDPSLAGYNLVYHQSIPNSANYNSATNVPYTENYSFAPNVAAGTFDRVAYYVELHNPTTNADQWVSVSFNSSSFANDPTKLGIPNVGSGEVYNQAITDLHVASNVGGVVTGDHMSGGSVQFWPSNYAGDPAAGNAFDYADTSFSGSAGYGHMEIGNVVGGVGQSIFAYDAWGTGGNSDLGIGNQPSNNPDWTFAGNASGYDVKNLYVLVQPVPVPEPASCVLFGIGSLAILAAGRRRSANIGRQNS